MKAWASSRRSVRASRTCAGSRGRAVALHGCGHCEYCHTGWEALCHGQQNTGYSVNGSYAEYVLADPDYVGHLPAQVAFDEIAPILCAGVTVYKGHSRHRYAPGPVARSPASAASGTWPCYARAMGLHVAAIDISPDKLALAQLGAELTIDASIDDPAKVIQKEIGGARRARHGRVAQRVRAGARDGAARRHGGAQRLAARRFPLPIFSTVLNGITVRGSIVGTRRDAGIARLRGRWPSARAYPSRPARQHQRRVREAARRQVDGRIVLTDMH